MPVKTSNSNRILAANARATDVANRAIQEILPVQQQRYHDAFRVQGFQAVLYNRLYQGQKCTCKANAKQLNTRLDESGKASPAFINTLITGGGSFDVSAYGQTKPQTDPFDSVVSPEAPVNKYQEKFDVVGREPNHLPTRIPDQDSDDAFGDNGPIEFDLASLASDFDTDSMGTTEAACAVCFGSGFVGGYSPLYGRRLVYPVELLELESTDEIDALHLPWKAETEKFKVTAVLPFGAVAVDVFRVMADHRPVPANFTVDGQAVNAISVLKFCDGRPHVIEAMLTERRKITHVEIQFKTSVDDAYFEFPKLNKSSDTTLLDNTDPFQVILSPLIPWVKEEDVITETTYGKVLVVKSVNTWNTRNRQTLGWEVEVRVAQQPEIYSCLPIRGRVRTKAQTTNIVHDNSTGYRRT
jgi:hypothetical protein